MRSRRRTNARLVSTLGVLLALGVFVLLFVRWGHLYRLGRDVTPATAVAPFTGTDLPDWFQTAVVLLTAVVVGVGVIAFLRPLRYPPMLLLACIAMAAQAAVVALVWPDDHIFPRPAGWRWIAATIAVAFALTGAGAVTWLGLFVAALRPSKRCPDCAEYVRRSEIDCPHCGYQFPLASGFKRCESCHRPIKAEAHVCRYCRHRVGEPVERVGT
jgi:hypothetical protein